MDYFGLHADDAPLLHMWSLAVEEQFYLFFPAFCLLLHRFYPHRLRMAVIVLGLASFALGFYASGWKPQAAFYLSPTRAWELMLGGALALTPNLASGLALRLAGPFGLALIGASIALYTPALTLPGGFALLPTLGAAALILGGNDARAPVTRLLGWVPLVWIGRISYPLYLVHWPIWIALRDQVQEVTLAYRVAGLAFSVLCAWGIYAFVENPVRSGRVLVRPGAFLGVVAALSVALMTVLAIVVYTDGMPGRFAPEVSQLLAANGDESKAYRNCEYQSQTRAEPCQIGAKGAAPTILLMGDSHARALVGAFDLYLKQKGRAALFTFASGCLPVPGAGSKTCTDFVEAALRQMSRPELAQVVLVSIWRQPFEGSGMIFDGVWTDHAHTGAVFSDKLARMTAALVALGKEVTLVDPLYAAPHDVPRTLARNLAFGSNWSVDSSLSEYDTTFAPLFAAFDQAISVGARHISLVGDLCRSGVCPGVWHGKAVFSDNNHLAFGMSAYMAEILAREMH